MTHPLAALRRFQPSGMRRVRLCVAAMLFGVVVALFGPEESAFRSLRYKLHSHPASGTIAIVDLDDAALTAIGRWPVPRGYYARAIDRLFGLGARRVFFNIDFSSRQDATEDARLASAVRAHRDSVFMANRVVSVERADNITILQPSATVSGGAKALNISFMFDRSGEVYRLPYAVDLKGARYPSLAAGIAGVEAPRGKQFDVDPSIDLNTIPHIGLLDLLSGHVDRKDIDGKDVIIGTTSQQVQDFFIVPPYNRIAAVFLQAAGAETLRSGTPRNFGSLPALCLIALIIYAVSGRFRRWAAAVAIGTGAVLPLGLVLLPGTITINIGPALAALALVVLIETVRLARDMLRRREQTNRLSGLLNLTALRQLPDQPDDRLVVAHVHNFAEAIAALPADGEGALIMQIAARLKLGVGQAQLYHGDNGVFAWFAREGAGELGERLDGLHALFRSAVTVGDAAVDLSVTFGIDEDVSRSVANRLGSALVAAAEAANEGVRWRMFDKAKLADAAWKLSLLSQLDAAIDDGHLWVAYQPKLDLASNRLIGAEALVRWTHPEKGAISPIEFVQAAEQNNRIERLTRHVLERAVLAAATINAHDIRFEISVNLSARLLETRDIVPVVTDALAANGLDPALLTLEVTETATIAGGQSLAVLHELRALGVRISIDDYGTGLSTLEYLKKVPASEIKIDKVFVQSMLTSTSDLLMVNSTIQLAHSLGHIVVAEGVETDDVIARLREIECDIAQGYRIGRPMTFQDLARRLLAERKHAA